MIEQDLPRPLLYPNACLDLGKNLRLLEKVTAFVKDIVEAEEKINSIYQTGVVNGFNKAKLF